MKRTIYLFLILFVGSVRFVYGDEIKSIKLDNKEHDKETVSLPFCNIFVELQQGNEDEQYGISIKMENISEDKILYLFDRSYDEKTMKKMNLVYDKFFPGAKGKRIAEACDHISESYRLLPSYETKSILSFQNNGNSIKCRLPIYIARYDEKNFIVVKKTRTSLAQKEVIELDIDVEIKPDEDFIRMSAATDSLIHEIDKQTFCSNKNHKGSSLKALHSIYNKSIDELKRQVSQIISSRNYMSSDKGYKDFKSIYDRLSSIDLEQLTVTSCDNDRKIKYDNDKKAKQRPTHNCKFCSWSAEDIYKRLEAYYIDLHNGKKTKEQVMGDVEALYNCTQKNNKRNTGSYMSRISMYYNRIKAK